MMADEGMTMAAIRRVIELEHQLAAVTAERDELARLVRELMAAEPDAARRGQRDLR